MKQRPEKIVCNNCASTKEGEECDDCAGAGCSCPCQSAEVIDMRRIGTSELRYANAAYMRELNEPVKVCIEDQPVAVLVPYKIYMQLQEVFLAMNDEFVEEMY